jgi:hypothetical protein
VAAAEPTRPAVNMPAVYQLARNVTVVSGQ